MAFNGTLANSNLTAGYLDLSTAWRLEGQYLYGATPISSEYGNPCAITYFVRELKRASWFTQVPVVLKVSNGSAEFGSEFSVTVGKVAEYLLNTWVRVTMPEVTLLPGNQYGVDGRLRWCRKVGHALFEDCNISFNETQVVRLDNYIMDVISQYMLPNGQREGYAAMIGDTIDMTGSHGATTALGATLPSKVLNIPLPFFFSRDPGVSLPTAALTFNDIKINFKLRNWNQLLILDRSGAAGAGTVARTVPVVGTDIAVAPALTTFNVWATYAILNDFERSYMADLQRDIVIEQWQSATRITFNPILAPSPTYEPKFTFAVNALFFLVRNSTFANEWSNYSTASPYNSGPSILFTPSGAAAPVDTITLNYDANTRLANMGWDYFSSMVPFLTSQNMPTEIGYGLYSYALKLECLDPNGSTNFSKLQTIQVNPTPSAQVLVAAAGTGSAGSGTDFPQTFQWINIARSFSVIRIASGQLTFPFI